jgi:hypothetical protein
MLDLNDNEVNRRYLEMMREKAWRKFATFVFYGFVLLTLLLLGYNTYRLAMANTNTHLIIEQIKHSCNNNKGNQK